MQEKVKNRVFVKLDSRYTDYFPEYAKYLGRALRSLKSMYGAINFGNLFPDKLTEWLLEAGFIQYQCQMSIYYKYGPYRTKIVAFFMLITISIGIFLKLLENGLWII